MNLKMCYKTLFTLLITLLCQLGFGQDTFKLITNVSELASGDEVIIVGKYNSTYYSMGIQNSNNRGSNQISNSNIFGNEITISDAQTFIIGKSGYNFTFKDNVNDVGFLYAASSSSNYLKSQKVNDINGEWVINISNDGSSTIIAQGSYTRKNMRFNANLNSGAVNPIFSCYASGQDPVYLYKKETNKVAKPIVIASGEVTGEVNTFYNRATITLGTTTTGASIYYTTDGTNPTRFSSEYNVPFSITESKTIKAIAVKDDMIDSEIVSLAVTIQIPSIHTTTIPYQEQFSNTLGKWVNKIVSGNTNFTGWGSSNVGATINGYNQGVTEAYLISPKFINHADLDLKLAFDYTSQYNGNNLKVLISTDYNGYGNPTDATWSDLSVINSTSTSDSLNQLFDNPGSDFHLALFYKDNSSWKKWNIKNFTLEYDVEPLEIPVSEPATAIEDHSFVANWNLVDHINEYELDVYTKEKTQIIILEENFDWANGTGGNDGVWSNIQTTSSIGNNLNSWGVTTGNAANKSLRLGSGNSKGSLKTPVLSGLNGDATLTFRAGAWDGSSEQTTLILNIEGGGTLSQSSVTMVKGSFTFYTINITNATPTTRISFEGKNNSNSRFFIDDIKITHEIFTKHPITGSTFIINQGTSKAITEVELEENTYYYVVRSVKDGLKSTDSNEIKVYNRTTWNGTLWDNDAPIENVHAEIKGDLIIGQGSDITNLTARSLKLHESHAILVESGSFIKLSDQLINLSEDPIEFEEGAYLIQKNDAVNIGNAKFYRNAAFYGFDSKFWASPVNGQSISAFMSNPSAVYNYNETGRNWIDTSDENFESAKGYAFQVGRNYPFMGAGTETSFEGVFTGIPNNGVYTIQATKSINGLGDNGLGNPYGSPLSMQEFMNGNPSVKTLYFWNEEAHYVPGSNPARYDTQTWFSYNFTGSNHDQKDHIGPGVGFIARVSEDSNLIINNSMRHVPESSYILNRNQAQKDRYWLSLNSENKKENQILIGYVEGATNGIDEKYDAKNISNNNSFILSHSNNNAMIIEGRQHPLDVNDQIPLYFRAKISGVYTIKLEHKEGIFHSQPIYLIDHALNRNVNLIENETYSFESSAGDYPTRFEIRYLPNEVLTTIQVDETNDLMVFSHGKTQEVQSKENVINYQIYDASGKLMAIESVNFLKTFVLKSMNKGTYILKFTLANGSIISKKVIF